MSFYFREKPRFGDKLKGKSGDELMQELKQQFEDNKSFFEPSSNRIPRDPFERHTGFSRGFPFDDVEGFGRRSSDIRSHLDDLASRHPEFADHLLGSAWGDIPAFHNTGSLRNRRRRGSGGSSSYQGHPDEDARSHTSGSSATSAASGASGVSSHGGESSQPTSQVYSNEKQQESTPKQSVNTQSTRRNPIPQYGLRNTVDIGQHRHEMENDERMNDNNRGQRSMSAPPENRQQNESGIKQSEQSQNPNQRFVSRVDITPQFGSPISGNEKSVPKAPTTQPTTNSQQKPPQQQSNVRHIPIFVEGRDEPVVSKNIDHDQNDGSSWSYAKPPRTESPPHFQHNPQFSTPPQFQRPSHFNQHYAGGRARDWLPNFEEEFYSPQGTGFQHPGLRRHQQPFPSQSPPRQHGVFRQPQTEARPSSQRSHHESPHFNQQTHSAHQPQPQQQPQQQQQQQQAASEPEQPRKQKQPKDPLEKVAEVQKEVDSLNEQVMQWNGKSRKDKQYMYLDEMLTRELIKLDDIETEGKENVRQARKQAIKSIQDSISLLESKAPLNDSAPPKENTMEIQQETPPEVSNPVENAESSNINDATVVDNEKVKDNEEQEQQPIPLPAGPSSPTKEPVSVLPEVEATTNVVANESPNCDQSGSPSQQQDNVVMEVAEVPVTKVSSVGSMEVQTNPEAEQPSIVAETTSANPPETGMEVETPKSPKTAKKSRKTKKQQELQQQQAPISDGAIPLPAPDSHDTNVTK